MDAHFEMMQAQLTSWRLRLKKLTDGVDPAGVDDYLGRIADLNAKHDAAQAKLDEFKAAGNESWERFRAGIWIAWNELENAYADFQHSIPKKTKDTK